MKWNSISLFSNEDVECECDDWGRLAHLLIEWWKLSCGKFWLVLPINSNLTLQLHDNPIRTQWKKNDRTHQQCENSGLEFPTFCPVKEAWNSQAASSQFNRLNGNNTNNKIDNYSFYFLISIKVSPFPVLSIFVR